MEIARDMQRAVVKYEGEYIGVFVGDFIKLAVHNARNGILMGEVVAFEDRLDGIKVRVENSGRFYSIDKIVKVYKRI